VAVDNWGAEVNGVPMTLTINNTVDGAISDSVSQDFAAAVNTEVPSVTDVTFDFSAQGAFVDPEFVYGISFNDTPGGTPDLSADDLNVALASSATDLSVGQDTTAHTIWVEGGTADSNDFPATCTTGLPAAVFASIVTNCGPSNPANPGAYGNATITDDIPAVEVNVVGGTVAGLYPGDSAQPLLYAITNSSASPVQVSSVSAALKTVGADVATPNGSDITDCLATWYPINNSPQLLGAGGIQVQPGTTIFTLTSPIASDLSIQMTNPATSQNSCEGKQIGLAFSSN
jgi:hypothetical protein